MKHLKTIVSVLLLVMMLSILLPPASVFAAPSISISPATGVSGTVVTIEGANFSSYSGDLLSVYFDDKAIILSSAAVSTTGVFQSTLTVPEYTKSGSHSISLRSKSGITLAESQFNVPATEIILDKWGGTAGTTVKAFCKGFDAGQEVSIEYYPTDDAAEEVKTSISSDVGECTVEFPIPASATGFHKIIAKNENGDYAEAEFEIIPSMSISPFNGTVGDKVVISGTGFTGNSEVDLTLNGEKVAYAQVDDRGNFYALFYVPVIKAGTYAIAVEDVSHTIRWLDFTVDPRISLNKSTGEVGMKLTVTGTGFDGGGTIIIKYDAGEISWGMADASGSFSSTFNVPVSVSGTHIITATDGFNSKQLVFTLDSAPPPVPKPSVPKRDSLVGAKVSFAWESVYDPSEPVSYTLQIARDDIFFNPILVKTGLSLSQYDLTEEEALRPNRQSTHYYWRVKATDSASNESDWSDPIEFQVEPTNTLPEWAKYALGAAGVLMVILLLYRIRKATTKPKEPKKA